MRLPITYEEISEEISRFTDLPEAEIKTRVWEEALSLGFNANQDVRRIGVTPHVFDSKMEELYRTTDAFIFECLVFWAKPSRRLWIKQALARILLYAAEKKIASDELKILVLGDGVGSDSLYLISNGLRVDYFDVPGSLTFEFAAERFEFYKTAANYDVNPITDYAEIKSDYYDVVLNFEVLEHLPEPLAAIGDIARFLKSDGIALVTEAFECLDEPFPTHLESNRQYSGRTGFMFRSHNLAMTWYSRDPLFKPMEFRKQAQPALILQLWRDKKIVSKYLKNRAGFLKVRLKNALRHEPQKS